MVTIKDVAAYTNLSIATISKYLNGGPLREKNVKIIQEAIDKLGYKKNEIAWSLKTNKSKSVGVMLPTFNSPFHTNIVTYIEKTLMENGYSTIICNYLMDADHNFINYEKEKMEFLLNKKVDGIIFFPTNGIEDYNNIKWISANVPVVLIDTCFDDVKCDAVMVDNVNASYDAVEKLIVMGHKRIGIILGPEDHYSAKERLKGYLRVHEDYRIDIDERLIKKGNYCIESGRELILELLHEESAPTAVFATSYDITIGMMIGLNEININIPEELSVIGFDDFILSTAFRPKLTLVAQPVREIGEKSAQLLIKRMNGDLNGCPLISRMKANIIMRETVKEIMTK